MWPKALLELVPHIIRLIPQADRYFQGKSAGEESNRRVIDSVTALTEGLRSDLGQVTASHAGLYRQLNEQSEKLAAIAAHAHAAKIAAELADARVAVLEKRARIHTTLLAIAILISLAILAVVLTHRSA